MRGRSLLFCLIAATAAAAADQYPLSQNAMRVRDLILADQRHLGRHDLTEATLRSMWTLGTDGLGGLIELRTRGDDAVMREWALRALRRLGGESTRLTFRRGYWPKDSELADALFNIGPPAAQMIREAMHRDASEACAAALGAMGEPFVDDLMEMTDPSCPLMRQWFAPRAMVYAGQAAIPRLAQLLTDDLPPAVSIAAAESLARLGSPGVHVLLQVRWWKWDHPSAIAALAAQPLTDEVATALRDLAGREDASVALAAARALCEQGHPEVAWPTIERYLSHPYASEREAAAEVAGLAGPLPPRLCELLVEMLAGPPSIPSEAAASALGRLGCSSPQALARLRSMLAGPYPGQQDIAAKALLGLGPQAAAQALPELTRNATSAFPSPWAFQAIASLGPEAAPAAPALLDMLRSPGSADFCRTALALSGVPEAADEAAAILTRRAVFGDSYQRSRAVEALGVLGAPRGAAVLAAKLCDGRYGPDHRAAKALKALGPRAAPAVPAIIERMKLGDTDTARIGVLASIGPAAVPALRDLLADRSVCAWGRGDAARELGLMGPAARAAIPELVAALSDPEWLVRSSAAMALPAVWPDPDEVLPLLLPLFDDPEASTRRSAALATATFGPRALRAVPSLARAVSKPDPWVADDAAVALKAIGQAASPAVPGLTTMLSSASKQARARAARALGAIGPPARPAVPALARCLADRESPEVRARATQALVSIGLPSDEAVSGLQRLAYTDRSYPIRIEAARALETLCSLPHGSVVTKVEHLRFGPAFTPAERPWRGFYSDSD